jgi:hypothetical protein
MMREFQAENDRHQTTIENNNLTTLINATTDNVDLTLTSNDQSTLILNKQQGLSDNDSNQSKININTSESRTNGDKNKLNIKSTSRLTSDTLAVKFYLIF